MRHRIKLYSLEKQEINSPKCLLWLMNIAETGKDQIASFRDQLDISSILKSHSFLRKERQEQFLAGRILLKHAISSFLSVELNEINIIEGKTFKPSISIQDRLLSAIGFSISHSRQWVGCAINKLPAPIGLDIEFQEPFRDFMEIARFAFLPNEYEWLKDQPADERQNPFYQLWTQKEALYKFQSNMHDFSSIESFQADSQICHWHTQTVKDKNLAIAICSQNLSI